MAPAFLGQLQSELKRQPSPHFRCIKPSAPISAFGLRRKIKREKAAIHLATFSLSILQKDKIKSERATHICDSFTLNFT